MQYSVDYGLCLRLRDEVEIGLCLRLGFGPRVPKILKKALVLYPRHGVVPNQGYRKSTEMHLNRIPPKGQPVNPNMLRHVRRAMCPTVLIASFNLNIIQFGVELLQRNIHAYPTDL